MSSRDPGAGDLASTVTVPGPNLRSRHVDTEHVADGATTEREGALVDELRCPTCGERVPGIATACPRDGTALGERSERD